MKLYWVSIAFRLAFEMACYGKAPYRVLKIYPYLYESTKNEAYRLEKMDQQIAESLQERRYGCLGMLDRQISQIKYVLINRVYSEFILIGRRAIKC